MQNRFEFFPKIFFFHCWTQLSTHEKKSRPLLTKSSVRPCIYKYNQLKLYSNNFITNKKSEGEICANLTPQRLGGGMYFLPVIKKMFGHLKFLGFSSLLVAEVHVKKFFKNSILTPFQNYFRTPSTPVFGKMGQKRALDHSKINFMTYDLKI